MSIVNQVQNLLRSTDAVKVVLDVTLVTNSESAQDVQNRRVLAVISHKDDWNLSEEGWCVTYICTLFVISERISLFVCKYKTNLIGQPNSEELDIQRVFPIYGEFSIVISQMRRGTNEGASQPFGTAWTKSVLEQPRAGKGTTRSSTKTHPFIQSLHSVSHRRRGCLMTLTLRPFLLTMYKG